MPQMKKHFSKCILFIVLGLFSFCKKRVDPGEYSYKTNITETHVFENDTTAIYSYGFEAIVERIDKRQDVYFFDNGLQFHVFDGDSIQGDYNRNCRRTATNCSNISLKGVVSRKWNKTVINGVKKFSQDKIISNEDGYLLSTTYFIEEFSMKELN